VKKRDRGVCAACGLDTEAFREELKRRYFEAYPQTHSYIHATVLGKSPTVLAWLEQHGMTIKDVVFTSRGMKDFWQADHTLPVIEGGGGAHWSELRTLCSACHRQETKALAARRAEQRRIAKKEEEHAARRDQVHRAR
jgi:5-methylcytosine-specific restriction endonuclease McrA